MATPILSDAEVQRLLGLPKQFSQQDGSRLRARGRVKANRAFTEVLAEAQVPDGESHVTFRIYIQRHLRNPLQFAVQLIYVDGADNEYRLLRLSGRTGPHTNELERLAGTNDAKVMGRFRVNRLTERYQASVYEEDGYAESAAGTFFDFESALVAFCQRAGVTWPTSQQALF